ncbi:Beige/BEACH domain containing protein [Trichomonas vaginalis G3]|uniref:Beige/BEACH domain containing protein n=1 Tax=Trichomonas vaginalis (strain ATCC PRA-98 / G3) TaxID=412133 RepID=A2DT32_TRIV3|nr:beige/BEACH-related family [Trichomonas vaginalis G3]EAY16439.1 Beige/BEACH domain containing protein [Trichomonas vaginalis G3]KAI5505695.1 beige/BEACH-related family [Trichomonas vaginalis G3]|eukprot:XP_001328662.1 Beige/BEACH domain containing protein [Trichomonas vaginalis G3]
MNDSFTLLEEPFSSILRLCKTVGVCDVAKGDPLYEILTQIKFPNYSDEEIDNFEKNLQENDNISACIKQIKFIYPFIHQINQYALDEPTSHGKCYALSLYFSFMGWISYSYESSDFSFAYQFLNTFLSDTALLYPSLAVSCFYYLYKLVIQRAKEIDLQYISVLKFFFMSLAPYPSKTLDLIDITFKKILARNIQDETNHIFFSNLMEVTAITLEMHPNIFDRIHADEIISYISFRVLNLEPIALKIYSQLLTVSSQEAQIKFIPTLAGKFAKEISKIDNFKWPEEKQVLVLPSQELYEARYTFSEVKTFQNGFNPKRKYIFKKIKDINQLIPKDEAYYVDMIDNLLENNQFCVQEFIISFFSENSQSIVYYAVFLHLFNKYHEQLPVLQCTEMIINSPLFDHGITFYNCDDFEMINTLRDEAFQKIITDDSESFAKALSFFQYCPLLLAELFIRCENNLFRFAKIMVNSQVIIRMIRDINLFLRQQNLTNPHPDEIEVARERMYSLFMAILEKSNMRNAILRESMFLPAFVLGFYEEELWPETTIVIQNYVCDDIQTDLVIETIMQSIGSHFSSSKFSQRYLRLIKHILQLFSNLLIVHKNISNYLGPFVKHITTILSIIPEDPEAPSTVRQYASFLLDFGEECPIEQEILSHIPKIFERVFKKDYSNDYLSIFEKMIVGINSKVPDPSKLIIMMPQLVPVVLKIVDQSPVMTKILSFLVDLMNFSIKNTINLHNGEVDSLLISFLYDARTNNKYSNEQVDAILNVISKIAMVVSNPNVVKQFVSLLCPLTNLCLSTYHPKFIKILDQILLDVYRKHEISAFNDHEIYSCELNQEINEGLSAICWISLRNIYSFTVFMTMKFEDTSIAFSTTNEQLQMTILRPTQSNSVSTEIELTNDLYYLVIITIKKAKTNNKYVVSIKLNNSQINLGEINQDSLKLTEFSLGFRKSCDVFSNFEIISGGVFPLLSSQQCQIFSFNGPLYDGYPTAYAYFKSKPKPVNTVTEYGSSFANILISLWKFDLIIPLFALFNFNFADGQLYDLAPTYSLSIIIKAALSTEEGLRDFAKDNKIGYISYLLTLYDQKVLTYDLYLQFYTFFQLSTIQELKDQIFSQILANMQIWYPSIDLLQILKHWSQILVVVYPKIFEYFTFSDLLEILRVYLWYFPKESDIIGTYQSKKPRYPELDIDSCRHQIAQIIDTLQNFDFTRIDLTLILSNSYKINDVKQVQDLLFIFEFIVQKINSNLNNFVTSKHILNLIDLISTKDETIIRGVIRIIGILQLKSISSQTILSSYVNVIINSIDPEILTSELFKEVSTLYNANVYSFLPFLSWYGSFKTYTQQVEEIIKNTKPLENYKFGPAWFIWPIIYSAINEDEKRKTMLLFLVQIYSNFKSLLIAIDMTCGSLGEKGRIMRNSLFLTFCELIKDKKINLQKSDKDEICQYILFCLLYRWNPSTHPTLEEKEEIKEEELVLSASILFENISKLKIQKYRTKFGFTFDKNNNWLDFSLALSLNQIYNNSFLSSIISHYEKFQLFEEKSEDMDISDDDDKAIKSEVIPKSDSFGTITPVFQTGSLPDKLINKSDSLPRIGSLPKPDEFDNYQEKISNDLESIKEMFKSLFDKYSNLLNESISDLSDYATFVIKTCNEHPFIKEMENFESFYIKKLFEDKSLNHERWMRLWSALRSDGGPWDPSRNSVKQSPHFKRDNIDCFAYCPFRLKTNHHYTNHADAVCRRCDRTEPIILTKKKRNSSSSINLMTDVDTESCSLLVGNQQTPILSGITLKEILNLPCKIVKPKSVKNAIFKFYENKIYIVKEDSVITINHDDVNHIYLRSRFHRLTAIEIFSCSNCPLFLDFERPILKILSKIYDYLPRKVQKLPFAQHFNQLNITEDWVNGRISNFAYLMLLNVLSGRSFNDLAQYPIFPWVIFDSTSKVLDLSKPETFRDFSKPIGAQNEDNLQKLIALSHEQPPDQQRYLFSSGPVSRLIICLYLLRLEPFASIHIDLQSGHFDVPERLVCSYHDSLKVVLNIMHDNRELIPEFFFMPEFLVNSNNFNLGERNGKKVDDIEIPPWSSKPIDFVYKNRRALESNYVSQNIKNWIDLIWGYKQRGIEGEKANNLYEPKLYEDVWQRETDPYNEQGLEDFLSMIGQMPAQLFTSPHPQKKNVQQNFLPFSDICTLNPYLFCSFDENYGQLGVVEIDGTFSVYAVKQTSSKIELILSQKFNLHNNNYLKLFERKDLLLFSANEKGLVFVGSEQSRSVFVLNFSGNLMTIPIPQYKPIKLFSLCNWFLVSGNDSTTSIFKYVNHSKFRPVYTLQSYRNNAVCCCLNETFKVQIIGCDDGTLTISSLATGQTINVINLGQQTTPKMIGVSPSWGFIVCEMTRIVNSETISLLSVFNINGLPIKEYRLGSKILTWTFWVSPRGFDYICTINKKGSINVAEIYYLNFTQIGNIFQNAVYVKYSTQLGAIVAANTDGVVSFIPYCDKEDW